jgi:hypothetical protein
MEVLASAFRDVRESDVSTMAGDASDTSEDRPAMNAEYLNLYSDVWQRLTALDDWASFGTCDENGEYDGIPPPLMMI